MQACFSRRGVFDLSYVVVDVTAKARQRHLRPSDTCLVSITA